MEEAEILELLKKALIEHGKKDARRSAVYNFNFYGDKMDIGSVTAVRLLARALASSQEPDPTPPVLSRPKVV